MLKEKFDRFMDRSLDIFFSPDKTKLYVLILFILGFIIRIIAANNMGLYADDAVHAVRAVGVIESGKLVEYGQSSILWYYMQESFYDVFGSSQLGSRMASVFFGSLSIILFYLFAKQVFKSKKIGLIAAVITTLSPFFVKMTLTEMDITVNFFIILSALFVFKFTESEKKSRLLAAAVFMGIAALIKIYAIFFAAALFFFLVYHFYSKKVSLKKSLKLLFFFFIIIFLFFIPTLAHNYLLYKDKGFMDLMFTNYFKLGIDKAKDYYGWNQGIGFESYTDYKGFFLGNQKNFAGIGGFYNLPGFMVMLGLALMEEPIILIFGILGILFLLYKKEWKYLIFFALAFIPPFVYLGSHIPMLKHFTFIPVLLVPAAAYLLSSLHDLIKRKFPKFKLRYLLVLLLLFNLIYLGNGGFGGTRGEVFSKSGESQLIDFKNSGINSNSIVVVDSRIYRGYLSWMFYNRNYIESSMFFSLVEQSAQQSKQIPTDVYFVECVADDCGWGTIASQPDFNKSTEEIVSWFKNNSDVVANIKSIARNGEYSFPLFYPNTAESEYRVYKTTMNLGYVAPAMAKSTHNLLMYPIGYDTSIAPIFDDYYTYGFFDTFLDKVAHFILYLAFALSLITIIFLIHLFLENS